MKKQKLIKNCKKTFKEYIFFMPYKYFEHTADIGIEAESFSIQELVSDSIKAVNNYIYPEANIFNIDLNYLIFKNIKIIGDSIEILIIKSINEILYKMDILNAVPVDFHLNYLFKKNKYYNFCGVITFLKKYEPDLVNQVKAATFGSMDFYKKDNKYFLKFIIDV